MIAATAPTQRPPDARLLMVSANATLRHVARRDLADWLRPGDLLIANDAATIPASLHGRHLRTGATVEIRLAGRRTLDREDVRAFTAIAFGAGDHRTRTEDRPSPPGFAAGDILELGPLRAVVAEALDHPRLLQIGFAGSADEVWAGIAEHGRPIQYAHMPEPLALWDVWTRVAALPVAFEPPSAGFLLDWGLLDRLQRRGIGLATLTHAAGLSSTGDPDLDARLPFDEAYRIPRSTVLSIERTRARGGRVLAVGTTVTRALEHAAAGGPLPRAGTGLADQRIGARTRLSVAEGIISGTHEPTESHYELLRAFTDAEVLQRMSAALERCGYRSHEFGDSVLIERRAAPEGLIRAA